MGRGSDYRRSHNHFMLFDDENFNFVPDEGDNQPPEFDEESYKEFLNEIRRVFNATSLDKWVEKESRLIGETDTFVIGIDSSGGLPCVFCNPKSYENGDEDIPYRIDGYVQNGFNRLIEEYGSKFFRFPTSAWTSEPIKTYERNDP